MAMAGPLIISMLAILNLHASGASVCMTGHTKFLEGVSKPESALGWTHAVSKEKGYFVSEMGNSRVLLYYEVDGAWAKMKYIETGVNPKGILLSADMKHLWVATDDGVQDFTLAGDTLAQFGMTLCVDYKSVDAPTPNGLCLDAEAGYVFATDPGYKLMPWGSTGHDGALIRIKVSDGTVTTVFKDATATPNGCTVTDGKVYLSHFTQGVTSVDVTDGTHSATLAWSESLKTMQNADKMAADGIVWDTKLKVFYVSLWNMAKGTIYFCDPASSCTAGVTIKGADIELDTDHSTLLAPDLMAGTVRKVTITNCGADPVTDAATKAPTSNMITAAPVASWKCSVCQNVYKPETQGGGKPFEEIPDTWICPVCGQPKSAYKLMASSNPTAAPTTAPTTAPTNAPTNAPTQVKPAANNEAGASASSHAVNSQVTASVVAAVYAVFGW